MSSAAGPYRILMVCMGNICRSPTAEGMARKRLGERGLDQSVEVDSAGTHAYHVGHAPDPRSQEAALAQGIAIGDQRARKVSADDFTAFDLILAMDESNLQDLRAMAPADGSARIEKIMDYSNLGITSDVPDPYYGGSHGFEQVLKLLDNAVDGLLDSLAPEMEARRGTSSDGSPPSS